MSTKTKGKSRKGTSKQKNRAKYVAQNRRERNKARRHARMKRRGIEIGGSPNPNLPVSADTKKPVNIYWYFGKPEPAGGGSYFKVAVNHRNYGTVWARNKYDLYRFLEDSMGNKNAFTIMELV